MSAPDSSGWRNLISTTAISVPTICMTTNAGTDDGLIPAKVLLNMRAIVTAGFANEVDDVNQYAAAM